MTLFINKPTMPYSKRLDQHTYFMEMAWLATARSTCVRRQVGCVLVSKRNHVLATGYNGQPIKFTHCTEKTCARISDGSGERLDKCFAIHSEINALLQCHNVWDISIAYITASPCLPCTCALLNTSCKVIIFDKEYPSPSSKKAWESQGRLWMPYANLSKSAIRTKIKLEIAADIS